MGLNWSPLHQSLFSIERGRGHFAAVFNLGHVFASLTENILLWSKMKWLWSHTDAKKKSEKKNRSCFIHKYSQSCRRYYNNGKFKKNVLFSLKRASEITAISDCVRTSTFCVRRSFIQNGSVIFYNHVSALQLFDRLLQ